MRLMFRSHEQAMFGFDSLALPPGVLSPGIDIFGVEGVSTEAAEIRSVRCRYGCSHLQTCTRFGHTLALSVSMHVWQSYSMHRSQMIF